MFKLKRKAEKELISFNTKKPHVIYSTHRLVKAKNINGYFKCPEEIMEIENYAFDKCINLTQINLPKAIFNIGKCAFIRCSNLTQICLPREITEIKECTFIYCENLTHIILPDKVTKIGTSAFDGCRNLIHITLPKGIEFIGHDAFFGCHALKFIIIRGNDESNLQRIRALLPQKLKDKVISEDYFLKWHFYAKEALNAQGIIDDVIKVIRNTGGLNFFNPKSKETPQTLEKFQPRVNI